jgi:hypothetical protein
MVKMTIVKYFDYGNLYGKIAVAKRWRFDYIISKSS